MHFENQISHKTAISERLAHRSTTRGGNLNTVTQKCPPPGGGGGHPCHAIRTSGKENIFFDCVTLRVSDHQNLLGT